MNNFLRLNDDDVNTDKFIQRLNYVLTICIVGGVPTTAIYLYYGLYVSALLTGIFTLGIGIARWANKKKNYGRILFGIIMFTNVIFVLLNFADSFKAGKYLLFFPLIVVTAFLTPSKKFDLYNIAMFALTAACVIGIFVWVDYKSSPWQHIDLETLIVLSQFNLASSMMFTLVFSFAVIKADELNDKKLAQALDAANNAANAKTVFLSNMSHELRTPLNGIIGVSNLLQQQACLPEQKEHLQILKYSSEHMLAVVNDVLDFQKIDAGKMEIIATPVVLNNLLQNVVASFELEASKKGLNFLKQFNIAPNTSVMADATRLTQVLSNLLSNAIKFTSEGSVSFFVKEIADTPSHTSIQFEIVDTGIGIAANKLEHIFKSFTQGEASINRKFGGTGLGLSISQNLVGLMGGQINVVSCWLQGSTFHFSLNLEKTTILQPATNISKDLHDSLTGKKVLLVEDNKVNMIVAKRFLTKWGATIVEAKDGLEGLEKASEQLFDLFLIDLEMPQLDGYGTIRTLRQKGDTTPALAFTAAVFENIENVLLSEGFNGYVQKPFKPEALHAKIVQALEPG